MKRSNTERAKMMFATHAEELIEIIEEAIEFAQLADARDKADEEGSDDGPNDDEVSKAEGYLADSMYEFVKESHYYADGE